MHNNVHSNNRAGVVAPSLCVAQKRDIFHLNASVNAHGQTHLELNISAHSLVYW